jgi:hypothetical protein
MIQLRRTQSWTVGTGLPSSPLADDARSTRVGPETNPAGMIVTITVAAQVMSSRIPIKESIVREVGSG